MYGWTHELVALLANYGSILYIVAFLPMVRLLYCTALYCTVLHRTVLYYYLFYSSAWFSEMKYHIRVAVSKSVYGPFHRCPAQASRAPQFYYRYCTTLLRYFL